jgi:transcription termination factor NusB
VNNSDRKRISEIKYGIENLLSELEDVINDLEERRENIPENLYYSDRAEQMEEKNEELRQVLDYISEQTEELESIIQPS